MLVTIITPTFNREDFLPIAVESVLAQTYKDWELIVVDDGSTDSTKSLIQKYTERDPRVRYFYQANQGQSVARNLALEHAKGDFVCFLDSDNYWPIDRLQKSIDAFERYPQADIMYGDCITIDEFGTELHRDNMKRYSGHITYQMLRDNCVSMNTTTTRIKCFKEMGGMSGTRRVADDYDLWLKFSAKFSFQYIPEYLAYYRVMRNQISTNKKLRFETNEKIILDFLEKFPESVTPSERAEGLATFYCRKARHYGRSISKKEGFLAAITAIKLCPAKLFTYRALFRVFLN